jgi:hypothetical protein
MNGASFGTTANSGAVINVKPNLSTGYVAACREFGKCHPFHKL